MPLPRYRAVADTLRGRIADGTYPVGTRLPGIAALQREFGVPGLNTVRQAQRILAGEGLVRVEPGVGAFVTARTSPTADRAGVLDALRQARTALDRAITFLEGREPAAGPPGDSSR